MIIQRSVYHGSSYKILMEWDPGPNKVFYRQWDPGGLRSTSIMAYILATPTLGNQKWHLDCFVWLALPFHTFLVVLAMYLAS